MPTASTSKFDPRKHVGVHAERVSHVSSTDFPGHYPNEDHSWDLEKFSKVRPEVLNMCLADPRHARIGPDRQNRKIIKPVYRI
jgi:hypothetical protein